MLLTGQLALVHQLRGRGAAGRHQERRVLKLKHVRGARSDVLRGAGVAATAGEAQLLQSVPLDDARVGAGDAELPRRLALRLRRAIEAGTQREVLAIEVVQRTHASLE